MEGLILIYRKAKLSLPKGAEHEADVQPVTIEDFLLQQQCQNLLLPIICGSVGDGENTLIGRLIWGLQQSFGEQA